MPKETFNNLDEEKRNKIINASIEEFKRVLYDEASINVIIKNAGISRGSFYMYFNDKEDLYNYMLDKIKEESLKKVEEIIKKNNGELFKSIEDMYDYLVNVIEEKKLTKNLILNIKMKDDIHKECPAMDEKLAKLMMLVDKTNIDEDTLKMALPMLFFTLMHNVILKIKGKENKEQFLKELNIIKKGVKKC